MKIYCKTYTDQVTAVSTIPFEGAGEHELSDPVFYPGKPEGYLIKGTSIKFDEEIYEARTEAERLKQAAEEAEAEMDRLIRQKVLDEADDQTAVKPAPLYPEWNPNGVEYKTGQRVNRNGILFVVLLDHTSQETWTPEDAHSLFKEVTK